jgi:CheY-like chemotaxis protein
MQLSGVNTPFEAGRTNRRIQLRCTPGAQFAFRSTLGIAMSTVSKGMVLVADDSADDLFLLSRAFGLSKLDYSLASKRRSLVLRPLRWREPCPALLLLDLNMPKANGFEVLEWIQSKDHLRDLPVVVLSSSDLDADKKRAQELGALRKVSDAKSVGSLCCALTQNRASMMNRDIAVYSLRNGGRH